MELFHSDFCLEFLESLSLTVVLLPDRLFPNIVWTFLVLTNDTGFGDEITGTSVANNVPPTSHISPLLPNSPTRNHPTFSSGISLSLFIYRSSTASCWYCVIHVTSKSTSWTIFIDNYWIEFYMRSIVSC